MRGSRRRRDGVTLFEAVAALSIVAVTSIAALRTVGSELHTAERAQRAVETEALIAERLAFLDLLTDRDLQSLPDTVASGTFDAPLDHYRWSMESAPSTAYAGLYDVVLTIAWKEGETSVRTAVYRRPPLATRGGR
jgi:hypothetical protein